MSTMADAFAPAEAKYKAEVMAATWGHLAPKPKKYEGTILFAHGEYGDLVPLRAAFHGLPDSPWFFDDMTDWIFEQKTEEGKIYLFVGSYTKFKNGNCRFSGKTTIQPIHQLDQ